jgi:hypothetical protein
MSLAFETRSLPTRSLLPRSFTFYVADPISFFPALRDERLPVELEHRLNIARCEIEKVSHLGRLEGLRTVHERERREIKDPGRLFHCGRRFDRIGIRRVIRRLVFRSTTEEATNYTRREDSSHHDPTAKVKGFVHTPR